MTQIQSSLATEGAAEQCEAPLVLCPPRVAGDLEMGRLQGCFVSYLSRSVRKAF